MNKEELKELKKGDTVCIKLTAKVHGFCDDNETLSVRLLQTSELIFVPCDHVSRGKVRRKFRKGDIVRNESSGVLYEVKDDEASFVFVYEGLPTRVSNCVLVCAVDDRMDRKEDEV